MIGAYGDWLQADGQTDKAQVIYQQAEAILQSELDKLERQEGNQPQYNLLLTEQLPLVRHKRKNILWDQHQNIEV